MCCPTVYHVATAKPREVTAEDVARVHCALEQCIARGMTKVESMELLARLGTSQKFTALVWERLEAENPEFFAAYYAQLEATAELEQCHL